MSKTNFYNIYLAFQHALTDCVSAFVVLSALKTHSVPSSNVVVYVLIYNFLAFGTELIFGYISDQKGLAQVYVIASSIICVLALLLNHTFPIVPVVLVGLANSLFHTGGGSVVLKTSKYKAAFSGIFIAPGALGLLLGTINANSSGFKAPLVLFVVVSLLINLYISKVYDYRKVSVEIRNRPQYTGNMSVLFISLFLIVVLRSAIGFSLPFPWRSALPNAAILLSAFIFVGKVSGGIIAERFGLIKTGLLTLTLSIPLILLGTTIPLSGMIGVLLFQMTTAITLVLIYALLHNNPGVSFGLTTMAIFVGSIPMLTNNLAILEGTGTLAVLGVVAVVAMYLVGKAGSSTIKI